MQIIEFTSKDFRPLDTFELLWRWTNPKWKVLPEEILAQMHPLKEEKAKEVDEAEFVYWNELSRYAFDSTSESITSSSLFAWIRHIDCAVEETDRVQHYLTTFEPEGDQCVIVMWEPTIAIVVPWHIVYTYFWSFCYPGSDDVAIWPLSEQWGLFYHHENQLIFGRPRLPLLDQATRERVRHPPPRPLVHRDEVLRLLKANEKIAAIKFYHQETGVGLKRAMDAVNELLAEIDDSNI